MFNADYVVGVISFLHVLNCHASKQEMVDHLVCLYFHQILPVYCHQQAS